MPTKLDNYTFEDFGLIEEFGHVHPSTPEFNEQTLSIPGRPGLLSLGTQIGAKQFNFPLKVFIRNRIERQRRKNKFVAFLFDEYRRPREFKLSFDYDPDKYYIAKVGSQFSPEMLFQMDQFELSLIAQNPTRYFLMDSDEIRMGSHIPIISHINPGARHSFNIISNRTIKVYNDGTLALRPRINISGTATSLTMKNTRNNQSFKITNIVSNKPVIVEGERYLVTEGGTDSFSKLVGKFIDLLPGENNIAISGEDLNLTLGFKYKSQFM